MAYRLATAFTFWCFLPAAFGQSLVLSECATNCTLNVTNQFSSCQDGIQCFCSDVQLYQLGLECFQQNCTIREALTAQNITALSCQTPDRDRGTLSTAVTFTSIGVALFFAAMHVIAFTCSRAWGWDDVLAVLAMCLMIASAITNPIARHYGYGRDVWRLPFDHTAAVLKIFYIGGILYVLGVAVTKMAFLCFYIRLFPSRSLRRAAYPFLAICFLQGIIFCFLFAFQCNPVAYAWLRWDGEAEGTCLLIDVATVLHAILNIVFDLFIFALPVTQVWKLNMSRKKKVQVLLMFGVGFFVTLVSILRLSALVHLSNSWDPTWEYVTLGYWSDLEFNIGIACVCMPSVRVVARRYFPNCGLATTQDHSGTHGPNTRMSAGQLDHTTGGSSKMPRDSTRQATADTSSDQLELFPFDGRGG